MVSPQHFQQQAAYAAWSAECIARLGLSHPWGVIDATFEPDVLKLGRLQARHLHIRFPDGTLIDTDNADDLPPVLALESGSQDAVVVLSLPLLRANHTPFLFTKEIDSSSPYLYKAVTTGQTLKSAEFKWYKINDAGQEVEYFNTRLENVKVVKVNPVMHDIKDPSFEKHNHLEQIELRYEKITWAYKDGNIIHSDSWNERATA
ncbi:TPA: type VI secretion system tube protein TssD [Enterobacter cloacae]|nr:type VI secretion system tube protein TssD [Enterobacter cloacae]